MKVLKWVRFLFFGPMLFLCSLILSSRHAFQFVHAEMHIRFILGIAALFISASVMIHGSKVGIRKPNFLWNIGLAISYIGMFMSGHIPQLSQLWAWHVIHVFLAVIPICIIGIFLAHRGLLRGEREAKEEDLRKVS